MIRVYHRRTSHTLGYMTLHEAKLLVLRFPEYNYEGAA